MTMEFYDNMYDELSRRLHVSRRFVKNTLMLMAYGAVVDPWLRHLVERELADMMLPRLCQW